MISPHKDYRETLKDEYAKRSSQNARYSLRAYARDLGMSHSRLNEVINYKRGISVEVASKIAQRLGYAPQEMELLITHVEAKHGRSAITKKLAQEKLERLKLTEDITLLQLDSFEVISSWYHYAILELTGLKDFQSEASWIAKRLGISILEAETAIDRLLRLALLERKKGKLCATENFTATPSGIPSEGLKRHHEHILDRAKASIRLQSPDERDLSALTLAIPVSALPQAKALIKKFRREFNAEMEKTSKKDSIYCLAVQFFRLDQKGENS